MASAARAALSVVGKKTSTIQQKTCAGKKPTRAGLCKQQRCGPVQEGRCEHVVRSCNETSCAQGGDYGMAMDGVQASYFSTIKSIIRTFLKRNIHFRTYYVRKPNVLI